MSQFDIVKGQVIYIGDVPPDAICTLTPEWEVGEGVGLGDYTEQAVAALAADVQTAQDLAAQFISPRWANEVTTLPADVACILAPDQDMAAALRADEQAAHELEVSTWQ